MKVFFFFDHNLSYKAIHGLYFIKNHTFLHTTFLKFKYQLKKKKKTVMRYTYLLTENMWILISVKAINYLDRWEDIFCKDVNENKFSRAEFSKSLPTKIFIKYWKNILLHAETLFFFYAQNLNKIIILFYLL